MILDKYCRSLCGKSIAALLIPLLAFTTPALSTSSIGCGGIDTDASIDVVFGAGPLLSVFGVTVSLGTEHLSTQGLENTTRVSIARAYVDDELMLIDLLNDQATVHVAAIRVLRYESEMEGPFQIGYFRVGEEPPVGILCDGP